LGTAIAVWRVEAHLAAPLALVLVATLGRWPAALAMGSLSAMYALVFLVLLDGQRAMTGVQQWVSHRPLLYRYVRPLSEGHTGKMALPWALIVPIIILLTGPFWRAVTLLLLGAPRLLAYVVGVLGSIPHSLLWTGIVLGGLWEDLIWPFLDSHWF
jgi:hypothetical protein